MIMNDNPRQGMALTKKELRRIRRGDLWDFLSVLFGPGNFTEKRPDGSRIHHHPSGHANYTGTGK